MDRPSKMPTIETLTVEQDPINALCELAISDPELGRAAISELVPRQAAERDLAVRSFQKPRGRRPVPIRADVDEEGHICTRSRVSDPGGVILEARLMEAFGTRSSDWVHHLLTQLANVGNQGRSGQAIADGLVAGVQFVNGIAPQNELEAALAAQMFAVHNLTMAMARRAETLDLMDHIKMALDQTNKLARTFAAQAEALSKLRGGGKQQVDVRHTYVDARGSCNVIGDVRREGATAELQEQPHATAALSHSPAELAPLRGPHEGRDRLPGACDQGQEPVQDARRREPRRAAR